MHNNNIENNKFITGSLLILALVAIAFSLNFTKPIMIPFVLALLIRILIDPIIDFQTNNLNVHRIVAVFVSLILTNGLPLPNSCKLFLLSIIIILPIKIEGINKKSINIITEIKIGIVYLRESKIFISR